MKHLISDCVVLGAGAAGMSASLRVASQGYSCILIEREESLGGILNQCIHNGFGLNYFKEELTGPEYALRLAKSVLNSSIKVLTSTTLLRGQRDENGLTLYAFSKDGGFEIKTKTLILSAGCRERNRGNIGIPGDRVAGVYTAGLAQRLCNIEGRAIGKEAVIVGSGDIGLIMARRLTWTGAKVLGVIEINPYSSGLARNISQCLNDFDIPLYLSHVVTRINGRGVIESVIVCPIKEGVVNREKAFTMKCDTLLLSVGLIPDTEFAKSLGVSINADTAGPFVDSSFMTSVEGVFACGNMLHVHDLADYACEEGEMAADGVCDYLGDKTKEVSVKTVAGGGLKYIVPNQVEVGRDSILQTRSISVFQNAILSVSQNGQVVEEKKLPKAVPSEMLKIRLKENSFSSSGNIIVSLREAL